MKTDLSDEKKISSSFYQGLDQIGSGLIGTEDGDATKMSQKS